MLLRKSFSRLAHFCRTSISPSFLFSQVLSKAAQRAVWACQIGKIIRDDYSNHQKAEQSLLERILKITIENSNFTFCSQIRKESLEVFTSGIYLSQSAFASSRIRTNLQVQTGDQKKIILYPTYSVTSKMFKLLHTTTTYFNRLVCGPIGIGKTISIVSYCTLYLPLHKYLYQVSFAQEASKEKDELDTLRKLGLIEKDIPKHFYWSIDQQQISDNSFSLAQKIYAQTTDMLDMHRKILFHKINKPTVFLKLLKKYYDQANIQRRCIIDQINVPASHIREWNNYIQAYEQIKTKIERLKLFSNSQTNRQKILALQEMKQKIKKSKSYQQKSQYKKAAEKIQRLIGEFKMYGNKYIFNSSINIEHSLIRQKQHDYQSFRTSELLRLNLGENSSHQTIQHIRIDSLEQIQRDWRNKEFYRYFWFQINRRLVCQQQHQEIINELRLYFDKMTNQIKIRKMYRFQDIHQYMLNENIKIQSINYKLSQLINSKMQKQHIGVFQQKKRQLEQCIEDLLSRFDSYCIELCQKRVIAFLNKGTQQISDMKKKLFVSLSAISSLNNNPNQIFQFQIQFINRVYRINQNKIHYLLNSIESNAYLPFQLSQCNKNIILPFSVQQFIQIIRSNVYPHIQDFCPVYLKKTLQKYYQKPESSKIGFITNLHSILLKNNGNNLYQSMKSNLDLFNEYANILFKAIQQQSTIQQLEADPQIQEFLRKIRNLKSQK